MDAMAIDEQNKLELLRNPSIDFTGLPNLATQVGAKSIPQMIEEFDRAGRAIMVANADENFPEMPGLKLYPDHLEAILLEKEVGAELMIARKRVAEEQEQAVQAAQERAKKNESELERMKGVVAAYEQAQPK